MAGVVAPNNWPHPVLICACTVSGSTSLFLILGGNGAVLCKLVSEGIHKSGSDVRSMERLWLPPRVQVLLPLVTGAVEWFAKCSMNGVKPVSPHAVPSAPSLQGGDALSFHHSEDHKEELISS